ncbi:MAG: helix-turn-helix domain-containing protein [bacterium]|nr:helix-turn-helix domain-containing protein [bacterium]
MERPLNNRFDADALAKMVRTKRGAQSLRNVEVETGVPKSTLSRIEKGQLVDYHNLCKVCDWLGLHVGHFFLIDDSASDDSITTQLRAAQDMSVETANAFEALFRAAYTEILAQIAEDERA